MYPKGDIYKSGKSPLKGEFQLTPKFLIRLFYHLLRGVGTGFVGFAVIGLIFSYYPVIKEEISYRTRKPVKIGFGDLINKTSASDFGLDSYFSLFVPKINAKANIISNVSAGDFSEYTKALEKGVAHAAGTNFPGQGKLVYLFSHSTDTPINFARYNAIFFLLRKLDKGDRIVIFFMGKEYKYMVEEKLVVEASDNSWLDPTSPRLRGVGEVLVLQTCDPPGTSLRRLIVVAKPIE
mgnify:FL=1